MSEDGQETLQATKALLTAIQAITQALESIARADHGILVMQSCRRAKAELDLATEWILKTKEVGE